MSADKMSYFRDPASRPTGEDAGQIKARTFPVRLKAEDWQSGSINWLHAVIAPDRKTAGREIANFRQVVKEGELRLRPQVGGLVEREMMEKMRSS